MTNPIPYASRLLDDGSLETMWRDHRVEGIANCTSIWEKATRLKKFAARNQWPDEDRQRLNNPRLQTKKPLMTVPETSRVLATFSGRQMMQRFERQYIPRNQSSARWAEAMTKVDRAVAAMNDAEQVDSAAFKDGPGVSGISWVRWYVDEWSGEKPVLRCVDIPIWSMMWPATREINLRDRAWHRWGSWWPQSTVRGRWPDKFDQIRLLVGNKQWSALNQPVGKSSRIPWTGGEGNKPLNMTDYYSPTNRALWIEYEEWRELVTGFSVVRPRNPDMTYAEAMATGVPEGIGDDDPANPLERVWLLPADKSEFVRQWSDRHDEEVPDEMIVRKPRMFYRYAYGCGDTILETGDLEVGLFTLTAMAAERVELDDKTVYIGLLEDLEDAQKMVNYMMSALIRDIQINPKGVLFIEQGLFRSKDDAMHAWTAPGGVIEIPRGRMNQGQPYRYEAGGTNAYSNKLESMLAFYREAIPRLAGFNPASLGQLGTDIRRVSGEVVRQLTDAAMVSNAERVDSLRLYRRECGRIFLAFARLLWEPVDLVDFIGEEDAYDDVLDPATGEPATDPATGQPVRILAIPPKEYWNPDAWKEIAIEEIQPTDDEVSALWDKLQTQVQLLLQPMVDTGVPIFTSEDIVDLLPIPAARRHKMLMRIKQQVQRKKMMEAQQAAQAVQGQDAASDQSAAQPAG